LTERRKQLSDEECERLIEKYTPLVSSIARSLLRKLPPSVEADDLMQDGYMGLLVAVIQATTVHAEHSFNAYLSQRIRGAMLDGLRENDHGSRKVRQEMRRVELAINRLSHHLGRMPQESEVAAALEMPLDAYQALLQQADGYVLFSLEDFDDSRPGHDFMAWCANTSANPLAALERKIVQRTLLGAINGLNERETQVMQFYYVDNLPMREVGVRLGVTEGRVSQIHTQAIAKLRAAVLDDSKPSILQPRWRLS
jgi:RNA polymerase sigma factor for flagellar operon FliA